MGATDWSFGPYRIRALLGHGGMGEVYRAFDTDTDREVALKLLPPALAGDPEFAARFRRECRTAARLTEPHVVPIHRFGEIDGRLYLDMRLVEGPDLAAHLRTHGPLSPTGAVAVVGQIAAALGAAHAAGLVHRDVKPSNILLTGPPDRPFAYLLDFGIATDTGGAALTADGAVAGSLAYLAPERFTGAATDHRVDVYGLACVLFESLTGRPPYGGDLPELLRAHLTAPIPRTGRHDVPTGLDDVIGRGLAKDPNTRFATTEDLARAARTSVTSYPAAPPTVLRTLPNRPPRRTAWWIAGLLLAVGLLVGLPMLLARTTADPAPPASSAAPAPGDPLAALWATLPTGFSTATCSSDPATAASIGGQAFVTCPVGPSTGPTSATFTRFGSAGAADAYLDTVVAQHGVPQATGPYTACRTGTALTSAYTQDGQPGGRLACFAEGDTHYLLWVDHAVNACGYLRRDGDPAALYDWWFTNDFRH